MNIKIIIFTLLMSLLPMICAFSQSTYPKMTNDSLIIITPIQLKKTNLIFLEHAKLLTINTELNKQIDNYSKINQNYKQVDSLRTIQLNMCTQDIKSKNIQLLDLTSKINKQKKKGKIKNGIIISLAITTVLGILFGLK